MNQPQHAACLDKGLVDISISIHLHSVMKFFSI